MNDHPAPEPPFQIDPWQQISFDAISSGNGAFGLLPCRIAGESSACICMGRATAQGMEVMPLFVAITPGLNITFPGRDEADGGSGGGPARPEAIAQAFAANKTAVTASCG